jgi:hypothetical protein
MSQHASMTWSIIKDNPELHWDYSYVSLNPNVTLEIVKANLDKPWNWFNKTIKYYACDLLQRIIVFDERYLCINARIKIQ